MRIPKFKNIFANDYVLNCSKEVKNAVPWAYLIKDVNRGVIIGIFYKKELQKTNQKEFRIKSVIKRKGNKPYVKWKGYYNSFNGWIDKKISLYKK